MHLIVLGLACVASSHGWPVQKSGRLHRDQLTGSEKPLRSPGHRSTDPLKVLARLFLEFNAAATVHPCSPGSAASGAILARSPSALRNVLAHGSPVMQEIVSPFDPNTGTDARGDVGDGPLELNKENVERVLDTLRPYLLADGGDVEVAEIDGPIVKLELQGACGTCASSAMTLKMGLEKGLKEKIPEIYEVIQVQQDGPELTEEGIEEVLDGVRPFLKIAGGSVELVELTTNTLQPTALLKMSGASSTINSVRVEIASRIRRNFPTLANIIWDD